LESLGGVGEGEPRGRKSWREERLGGRRVLEGVVTHWGGRDGRKGRDQERWGVRVPTYAVVSYWISCEEKGVREGEIEEDGVH